MAGQEPRKLTPKQERFCQLYTTCWEATRAAREAGYSAKSAGYQGYQLLQNPLVKARIAELRDHALEEIGVTRERLLLELSRLSYVDTADAYDKLGQLLPIHEMPENVRRAITKIKVYEHIHPVKDGSGEKELVGFTKEVEFAQKKGAIDSLAKIMGIAPDKLEHSGPDGGPIKTKAEPTEAEIDAELARYREKQDR